MPDRTIASNSAILHAFDWPYAGLAAAAPRIAANGFGAVLLSPPLFSAECGVAWWNRYQPRDLRVVRSYLGNLADLKSAIAAFHGVGVAVYVDIVFNHMANENRADRFTFPGAELSVRYLAQAASFEKDRLYGDLSEPLFTPADFHHNGNIDNWQCLAESTEESLGGLPDLELTPNVILQQRACLAALNALGIDGYRIDAVKHLPLEHIRAVFDTPDMAGRYLFGEALTTNDNEERIFLWPLLSSTGINYYDFPLHETMKRAFGPCGTLRELVDPAAFGQALPAPRGVSFTVTHDMPNNDGFRSVMLEPQDEYLANVYIFARRHGRPLVYSDGNQSARQYPQDRDRWAGCWDRADIRAMLRFRNAVGDSEERCLYEDDGTILLARGSGALAAINKTGDRRTITFDRWGLASGIYQCQLHGWRMMVGEGRLELELPPRDATLWLLTG